MRLSLLVKAAGREATEPDVFDPGAPGQASPAYRMTERILQTMARTNHTKRPGFQKVANMLLILFSDPDNLNVPPLTPQEIQKLKGEFLRSEQVEPSELEEEELTPETVEDEPADDVVPEQQLPEEPQGPPPLGPLEL